MGYVDKSLTAGEKVVHTGRVHWAVFIPPLFFLVVAVGLLVAQGSAEWGGGAAVVLIPGSLLLTLKAWIERRCTELAVTTKRIIAKTGLFSRETIELGHREVESCKVQQSLLGRILNYGTLHIGGTGGVSAPIKNVAGPMHFRKVALETSESSRKEQLQPA